LAVERRAASDYHGTVKENCGVAASRCVKDPQQFNVL